MKKKLVLFLLIILFFITFNYKSFLWYKLFLNGNKEYINNNFTWALELYEKSFFYWTGNELIYNIWNSYYKNWYNEDSIDIKIEKYKKSLEYYNLILDNNLKNNKKEDIDTKFNFDFVKNKLDELEKQKQKNEQEQNQDNNEQSKEGNQEDEHSNNSEKISESKGNKENILKENNNKSTEDLNEESIWNKWENEVNNNIKIDISQNDLKQIWEYIKNLKNEEKYNRKYYNNVEHIYNNSFFDNIFNRWSEKDW